MGYNSVAVILNDTLGVVAKDPEFGRKVKLAVLGWSIRDRRLFANEADALEVHANGSTTCASALTVISVEHADYEQVVIVGGNRGQRCCDANDLSRHALDQMKACLERHGYTVTKRRKAKATSASGGA